MDIYSLMQKFLVEGDPMRLARNSMIQFGRGTRQYLGATLLPESLRDENQYTEEKITYRTIIANDGTRYSEPQLKAGELIGTFDVKFGELDIARQLTGKDFDNLRAVAQTNPDQARSQLVQWLNTSVNLALVEKEEAQRWSAIVNASVPIVGTDGKVTNVPLSNPPGHRVTIPSGTTAAPAGWYKTDGSYDPFDDFFAGRDLLSSRGYTVDRIITSTKKVSVLAKNKAVKERVGFTTISDGQLISRSGPTTIAAINNELQAGELPPIETYNLTYSTQLGTVPFLDPDCVVMVATTLRNESIDLGDGNFRVIGNTLGYYGIGTSVGESTPGRVIRGETRNLKPVGLYTQGFQTGFPVITEPEAIFVMRIPDPTPV